MTNSLAGKLILITGAGKGSGRILAKALAERGAIIAANDISPINVEQVAEEINQHGGHAKAYVEDIAKKVGVQNLINQVEDDFGRIDILINHAAVQPDVALLDMDEWDWHRVLDVNLTGAFLMIQSTGRLMREQGGGVIINLIRAGQESAKGEAAYIASLQGLEALTHQAMCELSPHGIRVYAVTEPRDTIIEKVLALLAEEL
jgi:NAD(P)-dependent dehydrogenase (short-subunit alcohol dehydrogenase family)